MSDKLKEEIGAVFGWIAVVVPYIGLGIAGLMLMGVIRI